MTGIRSLQKTPIYPKYGALLSVCTPCSQSKFSVMVLGGLAMVSLALSVHLRHQAGSKMLHLSLFSGQKVSLIPLHSAGI